MTMCSCCTWTRTSTCMLRQGLSMVLNHATLHIALQSRLGPAPPCHLCPPAPRMQPHNTQGWTGPAACEVKGQECCLTMSPCIMPVMMCALLRLASASTHRAGRGPLPLHDTTAAADAAAGAGAGAGANHLSASPALLQPSDPELPFPVYSLCCTHRASDLAYHGVDSHCLVRPLAWCVQVTCYLGVRSASR